MDFATTLTVIIGMTYILIMFTSYSSHVTTRKELEHEEAEAKREHEIHLKELETKDGNIHNKQKP